MDPLHFTFKFTIPVLGIGVMVEIKIKIQRFNQMTTALVCAICRCCTGMCSVETVLCFNLFIWILALESPLSNTQKG